MKRLSLVKQPLFSVINDHLIDYPSPSNLNYLWRFRKSWLDLCLDYSNSDRYIFSDALYTTC